MSSQPDFSKIEYGFDDTAPPKLTAEVETFATAEQLEIRGRYSAADTDSLEHLGSLPGLPPFLRGPYTTMYATRPWTVRQYAGFSTAEKSNAFYRRNLAMGQQGSRSRSISRRTEATTATTIG